MKKFQLQQKVKSEGTMFLLAILGWHYAFLGKWGMQILFTALLFTGFGIIWWIVDLFRIKGMTRKYNNLLYSQIEKIEKEEKAHDIAMMKAAVA